jgi:hypothetical protein
VLDADRRKVETLIQISAACGNRRILRKLSLRTLPTKWQKKNVPLGARSPWFVVNLVPLYIDKEMKPNASPAMNTRSAAGSLNVPSLEEFKGLIEETEIQKRMALLAAASRHSGFAEDISMLAHFARNSDCDIPEDFMEMLAAYSNPGKNLAKDL